MQQVELDGRHYAWNGRRWRSLEDGTEPPKEVVRRLGALLRRATRQAEQASTDTRELLGIAVHARIDGNASRAEKFARRVLELDPDEATAAAILSSVWREKGKPKAALTLTERFRESGDPYVLTSRAAALADLGRWDEALKQIEVVFSIETALFGGPSEESLAVHGRIGSHAPQLFGRV